MKSIITMIKGVFGKKSVVKTVKVKVPNKNYVRAEQFTKEDYMLIDADREQSGIYMYSDEYYYNYIMNGNYDFVEKVV